MPQLDAYMVDADLYDLVEVALRHSCVLVPNLKLAKPEVPELTSIEAVKRARIEDRALTFFLLSPFWLRSPLVIREFSKSGAKRFYIPQKTGGPTIDIYVPHIYERDGTKYIPTGDISYYSRFINSRTEELEKTPESLVKFYKMLCAVIKKGSTQERTPKRKYYVTRNTQLCLSEGIRLAEINRPSSGTNGA